MLGSLHTALLSATMVSTRARENSRQDDSSVNHNGGDSGEVEDELMGDEEQEQRNGDDDDEEEVQEGQPLLQNDDDDDDEEMEQQQQQQPQLHWRGVFTERFFVYRGFAMFETNMVHISYSSIEGSAFARHDDGGLLLAHEFTDQDN